MKNNMIKNVLGRSGLVVILVLVAAVVVCACGDWSVQEGDSDTTGTGSDSGSSYWNGWDYSWEITGAEGSFAGSAKAHCPGNLLFKPTLSAGQHVATGYKQKKVSWVSGGTGHHGPLSNAKVTGQGDGTVTCSVSMNANNWDIDAGSCAAQAHGKIIFSGVCPGTVEVELNTTFAEGATTISGILSSTPSITITHTVAADIAVAYGTNSFSRSKQYDGNIAGQLQKGHGTCAVAADANNGAYASEASVSTNISALTLTVDYDGDSTTCMEGCH